MLSLIETVYNVNPVLFWFGMLNLLGGLVCILLAATIKVQVMGVNAWIKPMKFYLSIWLFVWTMGYFMSFLDNKLQVSIYTWVSVIGFSYENLIITWQAARGKQSHFNISTPRDAALFTSMGVVIVILNLWTAYIAYLFFAQDTFSVSMNLIWGIRLGIILSVLFAFQGGIMAARLKHTVGNTDGGPGLPVLNWSKKHGDLRVAHFMGIHALQIVPLLSFWFAGCAEMVWVIAGIYFLMVIVVLVEALKGKPVWG